MPTLDLRWIREQFPALEQEINGHQSIFFDGPGGTQVPATVIQAMGEYLLRSNANAHGAFITSQRTDALIAATRSAIADLLGCDGDEVVFGANMTTLTFMMSRALGRQWQPGDEIIVTILDHYANVSSWKALEERGIVIRTIDINVEDCTLNLAELERQLNERTRLVAVGYASNAVGTINDIATVTKLAHRVGALVFVDAVHYVPHGAIDVRALDCDFLTCSAYKFFGPHIGILYSKREHLEQFRPDKVQPAPNEVPSCWETGTQNYEGMAGLVATIHYLAELGHQVSSPSASRRDVLLAGMNAIQSYEQELSQLLLTGLLQIPGVTVYGITDRHRCHWRTPTVGMRLNHHTPYRVAQQLGDRGIFVWNGNFYALGLTERLGLEATGGLIRIGLVHYNTVDEIHRLLNELSKMAELTLA
jgi:cysteine desulfurase family protein (TIGR01976 family)